MKNKNRLLKNKMWKQKNWWMEKIKIYGGKRKTKIEFKTTFGRSDKKNNKQNMTDDSN